MPAAGPFDQDFLLETDTARALYHEHAAPQPIFDYHCHLSPELLAKDHRFSGITEIWLGGDHYKWRAMRTNGVDERFCTGTASDYEKFLAWAETVPHTLRNPLYHWTHLELKNPFGIRRRLDGGSAREIYDRLNQRLAEDGFSTQGLIRHFSVKVICTTDDPTDSLEHHIAYEAEPISRQCRMFPTFRPDRALALDDLPALNAWIDRLSDVSRIPIHGYDDLLQALERRHGFFHERGCRLSDHGLQTLPAQEATPREVLAAFQSLRAGRDPGPLAAEQYRSALLHDLSLLDHQRGWVQQFHLGALRNNNPRLLAELGPDTGFDSIGDFEQAGPLARFLGRLDKSNQLAKTILYNLNPRDNELMASMIGNFQDGSVPGKLQFGSAWWFLDQLDGMEKQMNALSNLGLLSRFVGMVTDSRSFLSYSRHEYFRRLLCNMLGNDVRRGVVPDDRALLGGLVQDLCFENAKAYFGLTLPDM